MTERKDSNIWPGLSYDDAIAARAWLKALGFEDGTLVQGDDGTAVHHSEMLWPEGGRVMVSTRGTETGSDFDTTPGSGQIYVVTADPDAVWQRARELGAQVVRDLADSDYGSRGFSIKDTEGNRWSFGTYAG
ncbi:VOC family protein [Luteipulveratus mongoliensis]|uniref:Glyoxalase n=1 Tax=Luteipulveratus mongoliensis TaxID=571913 RepID=A0A0K1JQ37_9MICO|nr:VOC family protein [Luteipulveratus mongoliensis]AKU18685.1 glyoxalase [Luteipulveratus mongoliensis]